MATVAANDSGYAFLLKQHMADVKQRLAAKGEPIASRIEREIVDRLAALEDRRKYVKSGTSGRLSDFQRAELQAEHRK